MTGPSRTALSPTARPTALLPRLVLLAAAVLAVAAPGLACAATDSGADCPETAVAVRDALDALRADEGLEPLALDGRLCAVARHRAEGFAAAGGPTDARDAAGRVDRLLAEAGFTPARWIERLTFGDGDAEELTEVFLDDDGAALARSALGDFERLGVGWVPGDDGAALVLLFATSRDSADLERLEALELDDLEATRRAVVAAVNRAREAEGVAPLEPVDALHDAAQAHADDMAERRYFSHRSPEGEDLADRLEAAGYRRWRASAENIARGLFSPEEVVERWLASPGHRSNMLSPRVDETGIGVAIQRRGEGGDEGDDGGIDVLWVQVFGRR